MSVPCSSNSNVLDCVDDYMGEIRRTGPLISAVALLNDVSITPVFMSQREWEHGNTPFLRNVRAEGRPAA